MMFGEPRDQIGKERLNVHQMTEAALKAERVALQQEQRKYEKEHKTRDAALRKADDSVRTALRNAEDRKLNVEKLTEEVKRQTLVHNKANAKVDRLRANVEGSEAVGAQLAVKVEESRRVLADAEVKQHNLSLEYDQRRRIVERTMSDVANARKTLGDEQTHFNRHLTSLSDARSRAHQATAELHQQQEKLLLAEKDAVEVAARTEAIKAQRAACETSSKRYGTQRTQLQDTIDALSTLKMAASRSAGCYRRRCEKLAAEHIQTKVEDQVYVERNRAFLNFSASAPPAINQRTAQRAQPLRH